MRVSKFLISVLLLCFVTGCQSASHEANSQLFCGYPEIRSSTQTNLWDKYASSTGVGQQCIMWFHDEKVIPQIGKKKCVKLTRVQSSCSDDQGVLCMAECQGRYVDD